MSKVRNSMFRNSSLMAALCVVLSATVAEAALTYNVDFNRNSNPVSNTYSGTAIAPDTGTVWNGVTGSGSNGNFVLNAANDLLDSQGNVGTADLTATTIYNSFSNLGGTAGAPVPSDLMYDYITLRGGNNPGNAGGVTLTFSDLPVGRYKVYVYSAGDSINTGVGQDGQFDVAVANQVAGGISSAMTTGLSRDINAAGNPGVSWVAFDAQTTAGGSFSFQWNLVGDPLSTGNFSALTGIQIQQIPEPSAAFLLIAAVTGSMAVLRRRQIAV